jgi:hypothetical protein
MPRVVLAGAAAWAVVTTGVGGLVSLATGWADDDPWYADLLGGLGGSLVLSWIVVTAWRARGTDVERVRQALARRRLPADGDPAELRRALETQRATDVAVRRWLPPVLALGAGGLLWLAVVDGAAELWVATASVVALAVGVHVVQGRRLRLLDALLRDLDTWPTGEPPPAPPPPAPPPR